MEGGLTVTHTARALFAAFFFSLLPPLPVVIGVVRRSKQKENYHFLLLCFFDVHPLVKEGKSATLKLPSEEVRLISKNCSAIVGQGRGLIL